MIYKIENNNLVVEIKKTGAELTSIKSKHDNTEYLWQGTPDTYMEQAQVLFPIIGFTTNDEIIFDGKTYKMPPHGFAKDTDFNVVKQSTEEITLQITDSEETLKSYPFKFSFNITYKLTDYELSVSYQIVNNDDKEMYFSIGHHPGFSCPIEKNLEFSDYVLEFNKLENIKYNAYSYADRELQPQELVFLNNENTFNLDFNLLSEGPIILEGLNSDIITLKSKKGKKSLALKFKGYPCCSIWALNKPADFICIQPWHGILPSAGSSIELPKKEGIRSLSPDKKFECSHQIVINE